MNVLMRETGLPSNVVVSNLSVEVTEDYNKVAPCCVAEDTFKLAITWIFCDTLWAIRRSVALNYCDVSKSWVESSSNDPFRDRVETFQAFSALTWNHNSHTVHSFGIVIGEHEVVTRLYSSPLSAQLVSASPAFGTCKCPSILQREPLLRCLKALLYSMFQSLSVSES